MKATFRYPLLGPRLQELRLSARMSISEVAALAQVSQSCVRDLEWGSADNPTLMTLAGLAYAYGVSVSTLIGEEPIPKARMTPDQARVVEAVLKALPR